MTPIEQVNPLAPASWVRRPEGRIRRRPPRDRDGPAKKEDGSDQPAGRLPDGGNPSSIDELA